ncbi:MlaC/ttg2D family ABC transporter substrate-binding protein [Sulfuriflexus mobilis]|uniref:MlaC/ttg2D family ABC transporter substrate-binding protein n=1 Tax=Sulfuriflexus mobilis TaxID=1811807 RepID=UPI000F83797F|nr:ABC transporter substrate-binding protein [Sulfuriflexus mobilis]
MRLTLNLTIYPLVLLASLGMLANIAVAAPEDAQALIVEHSNQLVDALKAQKTAIKADKQIAYKLVDDIVLPHVDFNRVARLVLGKYWRSANEEQRQRFTSEFRAFLVRTYVTAMIEFSDQIVSHADSVKYLPFRNSDPNDVSVRMQITLPDRPPAQINYSLYQDGAGSEWKIYDLAVEGISLATTYRSSFASQIRREGLDGLINKLAERNATADPNPTGTATN